MGLSLCFKFSFTTKVNNYIKITNEYSNFWKKRIKQKIAKKQAKFNITEWKV